MGSKSAGPRKANAFDRLLDVWHTRELATARPCPQAGAERSGSVMKADESGRCSSRLTAPRAYASRDIQIDVAAAKIVAAMPHYKRVNPPAYLLPRRPASTRSLSLAVHCVS